MKELITENLSFVEDCELDTNKGLLSLKKHTHNNKHHDQRFHWLVINIVLLLLTGCEENAHCQVQADSSILGMVCVCDDGFTFDSNLQACVCKCMC